MREGFRHRPPTPQEEEDASATRRGVIMGAAALGATTIGAFKAIPSNPNIERHALPDALNIRYIDTEEALPHTQEVVQEPVMTQERTQEKVQKATIPEGLQKQKLSRLERAYFGLSAENPMLPATLENVSFENNLDKMLSQKKDIVADTKTAEEQQKVYNWLARSYEYLSEREGIRRTTLAGFRALIARETKGMHHELDGSYERIAERYFSPITKERHVKKEDAEREQATLARVLKYLGQHITPDVQLAYIATEIMPSPKRGAALMSVLLENAGVEFLERIPALGDKELSYGPFQLTPYVVGKEGSVTRMQGLLRRKDLIPKSLAEFTSIEHHLRAGYLFGMHNIITLMQELVRTGNTSALNALMENASTGKEKGSSTVFLEYLAAAHHRPLIARMAMRNWLTKNAKRPDVVKDKSLVGSFPEDTAGEQVRTYAQKAQSHYRYIQKELSQPKT